MARRGARPPEASRGRMTPWIANGALGLDGGAATGSGGLRRARPERARERARACELLLPGAGRPARRRRAIEAPAGPRAALALRRPRHGGEHDVLNCSIAQLTLDVIAGTGGAAPLTLHSAHGAAYELGMRERRPRRAARAVPRRLTVGRAASLPPPVITTTCVSLTAVREPQNATRAGGPTALCAPRPALGETRNYRRPATA